MTKPSVRSGLKGLLFAFLPFLVLSCTKEGNSSSTISLSESDSVRIWIAQSKQKEVDAISKSYLLNKAYNSTQSISNDSLKCRYYTELSFRLMRLDDSLLFRKVNTAGLNLSRERKDSLCLSTLHWDLGDFFKNNTVQDSAYYHYVEAEKIVSKLNDDFSSGNILYLMAVVQNYIGDYTASEITTTRAIEKLKPLNKDRQLAMCYDNLGDVTKLLTDYDRALEYYDQSLIYLRKANMGALREQANKNNVGLVYQQMRQHEKAASYFLEVVSFDSLRYKNPFIFARTLNNLGYSYLRLNKLDELPGLFEQAFKIQDSINDMSGKASSSFNVAQYHLSQRDTANALHYLKQAESYAKQVSDNKELLEILRLLPKADPVNAVTYTQSYLTLNDSLQNQERHLRDKFARIRFETDEFIAENELLARQRQLWTGIALAILMLSISAFVIISQRIKNQKLKFKQTQQANNQEIFNLLLSQGEKLEEGKQIEQKRISEELHDGVQGRLQGARMMLLGLNKRDDDKAKEERARAIIMLKDIQGEVRAISHELSHAAYQKIHNFILSLEDLKTTIAKSTGIEIDFKYAAHLDWDALSGDIKINLYRIVQESLQNAIKHAQCSNIDLILEADAQHITVYITDDGKGFVVKKGKKGIGMRNISSRMKKVNGTWDINSEIGNGTKVTLVIPIVKNEDMASSVIEHENLQKT